MTEYQIPMKDGKVDWEEISDDIFEGTNDRQAGFVPVFDNDQILKALCNYVRGEDARVAKAEMNWRPEYGNRWSISTKIADAILALKEPIE
jgi:hypothetical protein